MQERASAPTKEAYADLPPCCGTGCAVCVLDLIDEPLARVASQLKVESSAQLADQVAIIGVVAEVVECCNTGCLICVRDYPELLRPDAATLQLLEAIERAQQPLAEAACTTQTL
jgi:hypothetical protein